MGGLGILCCVGDPSVPNPRISSHLARGEGRFPWHEMQACHYPPRGMGGECAPRRGAGAGPLAACPQGFVHTHTHTHTLSDTHTHTHTHSQLGLCCPPRSLILGGRALA